MNITLRSANYLIVFDYFSSSRQLLRTEAQTARSVTVLDGELLGQLNREVTFGKVARDVPKAEKQVPIDKDRFLSWHLML